MAYLHTARRHRAIHHVAVDIDALVRAAHARRAGRAVHAGKSAQAIQRHAEAVGRGEPSLSPAKARTQRG